MVLISRFLHCYSSIIVFLIVFTESLSNHLKIWQEVQGHYLLSVLEAACNGIPDTEKCISDMSEKELIDLLVKWDSLERKREMLDIHLPSLSMQSSPHCEKSKTLILPIIIGK